MLPTPTPTTKMPLLGFFVLLLLNCQIEGEVDVDYRSESKIVGVALHYEYQLYHDEKTFEDAEDACEAMSGHLITIANQATMTTVEDGLFEHDLLDEDTPEFFWIGLQWNETWLFSAGNPSGWSSGKYSNWGEDPKPDEDDEHCVGLLFNELAGLFKWHTEKCDVTAPYICQILNKKCLPWILPKQGEIKHMRPSKSNYGCPMYDESMIFIPNMCVCEPEKQFITKNSNEKSCDDVHRENFWFDRVCVPGCHPSKVDTPDHAVLLNPVREYYAGSRVDYYCPGYFEYDGNVHPHNIFQVPCRKDESFETTVSKLTCHPDDLEDVNKDLQQLDAVVGHSYHLKCEYKGFSKFKPKDHRWYFNGERVYSGSNNEGTEFKLLGGVEGWSLQIDNLTPSGCGVYICLATFGSANSTSFVPGKAYNVTVDQYLKAQAALRKRNQNELHEKYAGYYTNERGTYSSLQAYSKNLFFPEAKQFCAQEIGGAIAKVNGSLAFPLLRNLFSAETLIGAPVAEDSKPYPDFFWVGDAVHKLSGQLMDADHVGKGIILPVDDRTMRVNTGDQQCVGVRLNAHGVMELVRSHCQRRAPFVCSYFAKQCFPPGVVEGSEAEERNFECGRLNNTGLNQVDTTACVCDMAESNFRFLIDGHKSCNHEATWSTTLCVPQCAANAVHKNLGKLVPSNYRRYYYEGTLMTYFCSGHYEVEGAVYPQSSIQVVCDPDNEDEDDDPDVVCKPESSAMEDDSLDSIYFEEGDKNDVVLVCQFTVLDKKSRPKDFVWMHSDEALQRRSPNQSYYPHYEIKPEDGTLIIEQPNKTSAGVYMCFADFDGLLVPGSVHKLRSRESEEEDEITTTEDSSGASSVAVYLSIFTFCSTVMCHLLPLFPLGVLLY